MAVRDQSAGQPGVGQRLARQARFPMVQRPLRVEQVRHHPGARVGGRRDLAGPGIAVADADQDARFSQEADGGQGAGQFGGQGDDLQDSVPGVEQFGNGVRGRIGHPVLVVRPGPQR